MDDFYLTENINMVQDGACPDIIHVSITYNFVEGYEIVTDDKIDEFEYIAYANMYFFFNKIAGWSFWDMADSISAQLEEFANWVNYEDEASEEDTQKENLFALSGRIAYLDHLVVNELLRGRGIGTKAMYSLLNFLLAIGIDYVALRAFPLELPEVEKSYVLIRREKAEDLQVFYGRFGFRSINSEDDVPFMVLDMDDYTYESV